MKLAIASDLHLEMADITLDNTENADVLVLAGDIMNAVDLREHPSVTHNPYGSGAAQLGSRQIKALRYRRFMAHVAAQFPRVVVIAGNHELYDGRWIGDIQTLRDEWSAYPNVVFLERDTAVINGVRFIGATLWTDMNRGDPITLHAMSGVMSCYRYIRHDGLGFTKLRPAHSLARHRQTVEYFKTVLGEHSGDRTVVVGHHAPSHMSVGEEYRRDTLTNGAYYSDLSELILDNPQITLWICGHVHQPHRYWIGDTHVSCNPRGYAGSEPEAASFRLRYIDLDNMPSKFDDVKWDRD